MFPVRIKFEFCRLDFHILILQTGKAVCLNGNENINNIINNDSVFYSYSNFQETQRLLHANIKAIHYKHHKSNTLQTNLKTYITQD